MTRSFGIGWAPRVLLLVLPMFFMLDARAQEVRNIDGRRYMVHQVEQGQTLYAIGRSHAVPVDEIIKVNPGSEAGLAIGQELLIPQDKVDRREARNAPTLLADGELQHTVAKKETLFGISRLYEVDINALVERNPDLSGGLREGMTVVIPVHKVEGQPELATRPAVPERLLEHIVQPGETLYSLGRLYVVAPAAIQAANEGLPEGLKAGMTVLIPLRHGVGGGEPEPAAAEPRTQRYKVGLMLPFSTGRNDSILALNANDPDFYEMSRIAAQFYGGALLALDSMETLGLKVDVTVLDQGDESGAWTRVLRRPEVKEQDLFIGPFHRTAIEQLFRTNTHAHIVCPVPQTNKLLLGHPRVSKVSPTRSDMVKHTARYVAQRHARDNIMLLRPDIEAEKDLQDQMHRALQEALDQQGLRYRDSLLVIRHKHREIPDMAARMDANRLNVVVAPSEDVEFSMALVARLRGLASKYRIALVGMEAWQGFEMVSAVDLDQLSFMFASGSFIDREDRRVQEFADRFRDRFSNEPDEYAFLGFDVTYFYLTALLTQGTDIARAMHQVRTEPLHMGFRMAGSGPGNGFRNEYAVMLQQKDLRLVKAP